MSQFGDEELEGSFSIFFAEGEMLAKQGQYLKAIESFTKVSSMSCKCIAHAVFMVQIAFALADVAADVASEIINNSKFSIDVFK